MTEADFIAIESQFSIKLPSAYRSALCPFPIQAYRGNSDTDLWDDAAKLIELNRRLREAEHWPNHLFAVGCDAGGAMSAIDLSSATAEMWWIDRDIQATGTYATGQSFSSWAEELLESMRTGDYRDGFDPENDPPGTREQFEPLTARQILGCLGIVIALAVALACIIFGLQMRF